VVWLRHSGGSQAGLSCGTLQRDECATLFVVGGERDLGTGSYDATIFSDRVTVGPNGFTGAELGFQATCAADRNPGDLGINPVRGNAAYGAGLDFIVTAPQVRISWHADLAPAAAGDTPPELHGAQARLAHTDGPLAGSFVFDTTTDAGLGPIDFTSEQLVGPGRYMVAVTDGWRVKPRPPSRTPASPGTRG
jgi:hypothetical protein